MPYPDYPIPPDELDRQRDLERQGILNFPGDEHFDRLVRLTATVLETPIALISLVDGDRQRALAHHGMDVDQTPRQMAFCAHAIAEDGPLVVPDARQDPRFCTNPLVTGDPFVRFYAGVPLRSNQGHNLGTLCVIDKQPRHFSNNQIVLLGDLAKLVLREFEIRRLATVQPISGYPSRSSFLEQAEPEIARARKGKYPLALLLIEVDHFSQLRQRWGQEGSDKTLSAVAAMLNSQLCPQDLVGQSGDHQFVLLMVNTDADAALERADAIRCGINELSGVFTASGHKLSISGGLTQLAPADQSPSDLLQRAEKALVLAQGNGQNQTAQLLENTPNAAIGHPERRSNR